MSDVPSVPDWIRPEDQGPLIQLTLAIISDISKINDLGVVAEMEGVIHAGPSPQATLEALTAMRSHLVEVHNLYGHSMAVVDEILRIVERGAGDAP